VRGRINGTRALRTFVARMSAWLVEHDVSVEDVGHAIREERDFAFAGLRLGEAPPSSGRTPTSRARHCTSSEAGSAE
jgi:hypothetical protein